MGFSVLSVQQYILAWTPLSVREQPVTCSREPRIAQTASCSTSCTESAFLDLPAVIVGAEEPEFQ